MASRNPARALNRVCAGHYEGNGYSLSKRADGRWELIRDGIEAKIFMIKSKALDYAERQLDSEGVNWRPNVRTRVLETYKRTVK